MQQILQIHPKDNVAVTLRDTQAKTDLGNGLTVMEDIPQAHKIALDDLPEGTPVIRYGAVIGYAHTTIKRGFWVNEGNIRMAEQPNLK
jgi:galactarate dehydratase